ncbi:SEC-C metal-binding domain-containing protein [Alkaliphilus serpentinus]|uniref:SEC-C domain-containing protein n=1 Tax=Alkaliphilus serpentinus TaxID=1482731 RepID=A0A833HPW4_9FIRM|nr:SEC-C metal-binding domain-containing protein [Alkaliphilus serpentinus]KAB3531156.1 SEC-C domain-containing protein [Alkaliphilus serpentinus]
MSLYNQWQELAQQQNDQAKVNEFWKNYCQLEQGIYEKILSKNQREWEGSVTELAETFEVSPVYFAGFLDGINESIETPIELDTLEEETKVSLKIDFEKLYFNMLAAKADWLYNLDEWKPILPDERRKEIKKEYNASKTIVKDDKVGRNDPCICGSGKKYKKCCGAN